MNKNYLHKSLAALLAAAALTGCAKDKEEFHYIDLSQVACTFQGEDNQPLTVSVITAPAAWSAAPDASWVTAEKGQDGESLTITVEDNTSGTEREARITVSAGQASQQILVTQLAADNLFARLRKLDTFQQGAVLSPSGKYAGGFVASLAPDDSFLYSPTIVDIETGEWHQFGPYPEALYYLTQALCISDQGVLFIKDGMNGGMIAIDLNGEIFIPEAGIAVLVSLDEKKVEISAETCTNVFDYDKIGHTLFCRTRRQGDVIPLRRGRKKIKELFIDAKIPRAERERYPLFVAGDTVIWVPRLKEAFGADEQTDRKVWIQIRRVQE